MEKTAILFSVLLLGWTWTLQRVSADDDQVKTTESTVVPADAEGATVNTAVHDATEHSTTLHNATDAALNSAPFNATETCVKAPETGPCKAYKVRYFSNSTSKSCEKFVYGGCGGNRNNFQDEKACMQRCHTEGMAVLGAEEGEEREEREDGEEGEEEEEHPTAA
ncbi:kunitz-type protease inhibitor 2-like isoform X3 [Epinephelus moara]|uniref:kunitz-type protease inhibitor 2-like isoform X3 n=1 Tax=Epinephelus moara TaxID=300413 RepID=UPI00214F41E9|nr:kunitz-type protease inhibitor 2-like isoform X3 [Epinephelus moara]